MEPFPLHLYPEYIRKFCKQATQNTGSPESFIPAAIIPAIGTALGANCVLTVGKGWQERPCLWMVLVGGSGLGKNPAIDTVIKPLLQVDREIHEQSRADYAAWRALDAEERRDPANPKPVARHLIVTSPTIESVRQILGGNPDGILLSSGELASWVNGMGEYKGGRGADRQIWLDIYSGAALKATRASDEFGEAIYNPFVCVLGGIQPKILGKLLGPDGLHARLLYVAGEDKEATGLPPMQPEDGSTIGYSEWDTFIRLLIQDREREPHRLLMLDAMAHKRCSEWKKWVEATLCKTCDKEENWRMTCNKIVGTALRLAIIFWAMETCQGRTITERQMSKAIELAEWFLRSAEDSLDLADLSTANQQEEAARLDALRRWIETKKVEGKAIDTRYVSRNGPAWVRSKRAAEEALRNLGYGTVG